MQGMAEGARQGAMDALPFGASFRGQRRGRYGRVQRVTYGLGWAFLTLLFLVGGVLALAHGDWIGAVMILASIAAGYYDFQIWTYRARRLWTIR
jgi:hypothetical protein